MSKFVKLNLEEYKEYMGLVREGKHPLKLNRKEQPHLVARYERDEVSYIKGMTLAHRLPTRVICMG